MEEVYNTFDIQTDGPDGKFPKYINGTLRNPSSSILLDGYIPADRDELLELCNKHDISLQGLYENALKKANLPRKLITLWSVLELKRALLPYSAYQIVDDAAGKPFKEVVYGASVLPETIHGKLKAKGVPTHLRKAVSKVSFNDDGTGEITIHLKDGQRKKYDKVVVTPTSRVVSRIQFFPPLPNNKKLALNSFHFMNSVKVFLAFKTPFWEKETKLPPIPYNSSHRVNGGSVVTDLANRVVYYPSHPYHGPALLASYVLGEDADRLTSLSDDQLQEEILNNLVEIHGEVARKEYKEGKVIKWVTEDWTAGAIPWAYPGQIHQLELALQESHMGKVFFAGDYTSKVGSDFTFTDYNDFLLSLTVAG